jgi:tetrahydromethanopterin S-methyltransferase subunit C
VILLVVGNFMAVLDVTIVNVAIPAIRRTSAAH